MTFAQLLGLTADDLEKLSDEDLIKYLGPQLKDCPPVDIKIFEEAEAKIKLEKLAKKTEEKEKRKADRAILKAQNVVVKTTTKPKVTANQLSSINAMMELMKKQLAEQQAKK